MRYDYLQKYWNKYSDGGFKRLLKGGYSFANANFNYVPTYTGPGHAAVYTGTTPSVNGIVGNEWYDRNTGKQMYCSSDSTVRPVGTTSEAGKMSPRNLMVSTVTDELRKSDPHSKVISMDLKDRAAIFTGGHHPNGAYWNDPSTGNFITSTYYMNDLPLWIKQFNDRHLVDSFLSRPWNTMLPIEQYTESTADDTPYEGVYKGEQKPVFPHDLPAIRKLDKELIRRTPFGNTYTKEFAEAAIVSEQLGKSSSTDFLALNFASTDYVGHQFGTMAIEVEDTYIRLDKDVADLLNFLDKQIGKGNYLVFLTADHGAADNPLYAKDQGRDADFFNSKKMLDSIKTYLNSRYRPDNYIVDGDAHGIYFDNNLVAITEVGTGEIAKTVCQIAEHFEGVAKAVVANKISETDTSHINKLIRNGYYEARSPDIYIELKPGWIEWRNTTGTSHGSSYNYDTHVPVIFYGWNIKHGESDRPVEITDIAPTVSSLLNISNPSGSTGKLLIELISK